MKGLLICAVLATLVAILFYGLSSSAIPSAPDDADSPADSSAPPAADGKSEAQNKKEEVVRSPIGSKPSKGPEPEGAARSKPTAPKSGLEKRLVQISRAVDLGSFREAAKRDPSLLEKTRELLDAADQEVNNALEQVEKHRYDMLKSRVERGLYQYIGSKDRIPDDTADMIVASSVAFDRSRKKDMRKLVKIYRGECPELFDARDRFREAMKLRGTLLEEHLKRLSDR